MIERTCEYCAAIFAWKPFNSMWGVACSEHCRQMLEKIRSREDGTTTTTKETEPREGEVNASQWEKSTRSFRHR